MSFVNMNHTINSPNDEINENRFLFYSPIGSSNRILKSSYILEYAKMYRCTETQSTGLERIQNNTDRIVSWITRSTG